jgi:hypothetical protein
MNPHSGSMKMERKFFEMEVASLSLNYRQKIDMKAVDWYWRHLEKYPKENLIRTFKLIIEKEEYFPTIAVFKKYLDPELELFQTTDTFPTYKEIKVREPVGKESLDLIFKVLDRKITFEEYCESIERLEEKFPEIGFKKAAEALRKQRKVYETLPVLNWKAQEWPLSRRDYGGS